MVSRKSSNPRLYEAGARIISRCDWIGCNSVRRNCNRAVTKDQRCNTTLFRYLTVDNISKSARFVGDRAKPCFVRFGDAGRKCAGQCESPRNASLSFDHNQLFARDRIQACAATVNPCQSIACPIRQGCRLSAASAVALAASREAALAAYALCRSSRLPESSRFEQVRAR